MTYTWEIRIFRKLHMDFLILPNFSFPSRKTEDCSESAMLFWGGKSWPECFSNLQFLQNPGASAFSNV